MSNTTDRTASEAAERHDIGGGFKQGSCSAPYLAGIPEPVSAAPSSASHNVDLDKSSAPGPSMTSTGRTDRVSPIATVVSHSGASNSGSESSLATTYSPATSAATIAPPLTPPAPSTSPLPARAGTIDNSDALFASVPEQLKQGTQLLKVSAKKVQRRLVRLKPEAGQFLWESKHTGMLNIENIRELRFAADARGFRKQFKMASDAESRWICIIYTAFGKFKILHFVALTDDVFLLWKNTLASLYDQRKALMGGLDQMRTRQNVWLKQSWSNADLDNDQKLDLRDVEKLCRNLNISASESDIQANFQRADAKSRGFLDFTDFQMFVKYLRRRPEIEVVMRHIGDSDDIVPYQNFHSFLKSTQRGRLPDETIRAVYHKFADATRRTGTEDRLMTTEGFTSFLLSSDNMAIDESQLRVCDDMKRPLCEYYMSSSHNTYLLGGQLKGESTAEGYIRALQQGCRTVELDVWDGPNDEPVVYHGRTLTTKLLLRDACAAIGKYAFIASPYPVILSFEIHCDQAQQDKVAEILRSTLGKALLDGPLFGETVVEEHANCPVVDSLPSPDELKYRILVKAKNLYVVKASQKSGETNAELASEESSSSASSDSDFRKVFSSAMRMIRPSPSPPVVPSSQSPPTPPPLKQSTGFPNLAPPERQAVEIASATGSGSATAKDSKRLSLSRTLSRTRSRSSASSSSAAGTGEAREKPLMSFALASLIVYTVGVKWRGLNKKEQYGASHVISLGEKRAQKIIKEARNDLISHNRTHLLRAYPAGMRFTSSNYLPHHFWAVGVQMVALNWQTYDLGLEINTAFFQRNGRCGYVLKPEILRMKSKGEKDKEALVKIDRYILMIEVLSAQQLPRPHLLDDDPSSPTEDPQPSNKVIPMNPLIEITILSPTLPPGELSKFRTSCVSGNGFNPVFSDNKFHIPFTVQSEMLDLAFVRLEVLSRMPNGDEVSLGKYTASLTMLMPGYRHVPLYDHLGQQYLFSSVFIYTQLQKQ